MTLRNTDAVIDKDGVTVNVTWKKSAYQSRQTKHGSAEMLFENVKCFKCHHKRQVVKNYKNKNNYCCSQGGYLR